MIHLTDEGHELKQSGRLLRHSAKRRTDERCCAPQPGPSLAEDLTIQLLSEVTNHGCLEREGPFKELSKL